MPTSVSYFENLLFGTVVLSVLSTYLSYDALLAGMDVPVQVPVLTVWLVVVAILAVWVIFVVLASRLRMNWARWVVAVWIGLSVLFSYSAIADVFAIGTVATMVSGGLQIAIVLMEVAAVVFVFSSDARSWFGR
jgi:hypothetical protein